MTKYAQIYPLSWLLVFCTCCGQNHPDLPTGTSKSDFNDTVTPYGPTTMVRNIKNGRNGTLLIAASWGGVFRYDGKSFTNLARKIGARRYWDVLEDRKGNVWFASTDSGAYCCNGTSFQHFTTREGLASNTVMALYEDKAGRIWFGTSGGVSRYDGTSFRNFTTKEGLPQNSVTTIMADRTGKVWIGTGSGPCFYDGKIVTVVKHNDGEAFSNVWSIAEDQTGHIWFGGSIIKEQKRISVNGTISTLETGLWRYDGRRVTKVSQRGAAAILADKKGNIWTTGVLKPNGNWVLSRYEQGSLYSKKPTIADIKSQPLMLCGLVEATDGSIWAGSMQGLYRYDGKTITDFKKVKRGRKNGLRWSSQDDSKGECAGKLLVNVVGVR